MARVYRKLGRYKDAETLYIRSLELKKQLIGEDNVQVAESVRRLPPITIPIKLITPMLNHSTAGP